MPEDYDDIVLAAYKKMRDNGKLQAILPESTTTRLRKAFLKVYDSINNPNDIDILSMFLKVDKLICDDFQKVIDDSDADDFKALYNHIKKGKGKTSEENTDLLAWLIDFPTYNEWRELSEKELKLVFEEVAKKPIKEERQEEEDKNDVEEDLKSEEEVIPVEGSNDDQPKDEEFEEEGQSSGELEDDEGLEENDLGPMFIPRFSIRQITVASIILLFIGTTSFVACENSVTAIRTPNADEKFMYWDEDHYEPIKDGKKILVCQ